MRERQTQSTISLTHILDTWFNLKYSDTDKDLGKVILLKGDRVSTKQRRQISNYFHEFKCLVYAMTVTLLLECNLVGAMDMNRAIFQAGTEIRDSLTELAYHIEN